MKKNLKTFLLPTIFLLLAGMVFAASQDTSLTDCKLNPQDCLSISPAQTRLVAESNAWVTAFNQAHNTNLPEWMWMPVRFKQTVIPSIIHAEKFVIMSNAQAHPYDCTLNPQDCLTW